MPLKQIRKFMLPEHTNTLYEKEAISSISLTKEVASKINELVDAYNKLSLGNLEKDQEQDGKINKAVIYMKDNLLNTLDELLQLYIDNGIIREKIIDYFEYLKPYTDLVVEPSGDTTGYNDYKHIQDKLDKCNTVILSAGEYHLYKPLTLKSGSYITGKGTVNTVIHCKQEFATIGDASADNIIISELKVKGTDAYTGLKLIGTTTGQYTGARYSRFTKVHLESFGKCVELRGAWCVGFYGCRFDTTGTGVEESGTCNNVTYELCQFLGVDKTQVGLFANATSGSENYTVTLKDCNFERLQYGIRGYAVVGLSASNVHAEGVDRLFSLDSCTNFNADSIYCVGVNKLVNYTKSNTAAIFENCTGVITNVFIKLDSDEVTNLMDASSGCVIEHHNINVINAGTGKTYMNSSDYGSRANNRSNHPTITVYTDSIDVATTTNTAYAPSIMRKPNEQVKLTDAKLIATNDFTLASNISVYINNSKGRAYLIYVNSGTHSKGKEFTGSQVEPITNLIDSKSDNYYLQGGTGVNTNVPIKAKLTFLVGEMEV